MNQTSAPYPRGVNELLEAGLTPAPCRLVKPPRVAEAPCALECKWLDTIELNDVDGKPVDGWVVIGRVVGVVMRKAGYGVGGSKLKNSGH